MVALAAAAVAAFLGITSVRIVHEAGLQEVHPADAIVVFGAAEYAGRPSPVFRARLDHAYDLFQRGAAPVVITTGGSGADPTFSEGGVGHDYLMHRGIPESKLIAETQGSDTASSAERVAVIMTRQPDAQLRGGQRRLPCIPHPQIAGARRSAGVRGAASGLSPAIGMAASDGGAARSRQLSCVEAEHSRVAVILSGACQSCAKPPSTCHLSGTSPDGACHPERSRKFARELSAKSKDPYSATVR